MKRPGVYEASMNITLRELIDGYAGGVRDGRTLKAVIPGGSSVPILLPDQLDTQASFDGVQKAGSLLGSAGDHRARRHDLHGLARREPAALLPPRVVRQVHAVPRRHRLAATRSCSKIERGEGQMRDLDLLSSISGNIAGKTLCAFGDAAVTPVLTTLKHFRHEYEAHIREGRCTLPADWRARQPAWERTDDMLVPHDRMTPLLIAQIVLTLVVFVALLHSAAVDGVRRAQGRGAAAAAPRARPASARRACCSRSPTSSS